MGFQQGLNAQTLNTVCLYSFPLTCLCYELNASDCKTEKNIHLMEYLYFVSEGCPFKQHTLHLMENTGILPLILNTVKNILYRYLCFQSINILFSTEYGHWKDSRTFWIVYYSAPKNYYQCQLTNEITVLVNSFKINYCNISSHQGLFPEIFELKYREIV